MTDAPFGDAASSEDFADFDGYDPEATGIADTETDAPVDFESTSDAVDLADDACEPDETDGPVAPVTGNPRVDGATAALDDLADRPTADHADVFEEVHRRLQGALADLDGD